MSSLTWTLDLDSARLTERRLQITLAVMISLSALMLGMGQQNIVLPLIATVASGLSLYVTDIKGLFRLSRPLANLAGIAALVITGLDYLHRSQESQLFAVSNLLIYLQVAMLFQEKTLRLYPQIIVLSWLQVVVAAALSLSVWFAGLVLVYLALVLAAIGLLYVLREAHRWRLRQQAIHLPEDQAFDQRLESDQSGMMFTVRQSLLSRRVAWQMALSSVVALVVFVGIPRTGQSNFSADFLSSSSPTISVPPASVGFSENVSLGALNELAQDTEVVMTVRFFDGKTRAPYAVHGDPMFRGSVLVNYQKGQWRNGNGKTFELDRLDRPPAKSDYVIQQITIEPMDHEVLFSIYRPWSVDNSALYDQFRRCLSRPRRLASQRFTYEIGTTGLHFGRQRPIVGNFEILTRPQDLLKLPPVDSQSGDPLAGLKETAARWIREEQPPPKGRIEIARLLESKLSSRLFTYTLRPAKRDPQLDPIEDFVTKNRQGHCQFFATALVMMLRSQGIPARLAVGYKGGQLNDLGRFYQVRQSDAHVWVEALLRNEDIPLIEQSRPGEFDRDLGGWLMLDPSPAGDSRKINAVSRLWSSARGYFDYAQLVWSEYVVGLNGDRQAKSIYQPLSEYIHATGLFNAESWRSWLGVWISGRADSAAGKPNHPAAVAIHPSGTAWHDWCALLVLEVLAAWTVLRLLRLDWRRYWARFARSRKAADSLSIGWYRRLERLLARQGLRRKVGQTQREFALAAGGLLAASSKNAALASLPRQIVDAYYWRRFGGPALDNHQADEVEQAIRQLEAGLSRRHIWPWQKAG